MHRNLMMLFSIQYRNCTGTRHKPSHPRHKNIISHKFLFPLYKPGESLRPLHCRHTSPLGDPNRPSVTEPVQHEKGARSSLFIWVMYCVAKPSKKVMAAALDFRAGERDEADIMELLMLLLESLILVSFI